MLTNNNSIAVSDRQIQDAQTCIHRVRLDLYGDHAFRAEENAFVQMLWRNSMDNVLATLSSVGNAHNISGLPDNDLLAATLDAMYRQEPLIFGGLLLTERGRANPSFLVRDGLSYFPGKVVGHLENTVSVSAMLSLAHAVALLGELGFGNAERHVILFDKSGQRKTLSLNAQRSITSPATWWDAYKESLSSVLPVVGGEAKTLPALCASCKLCCWQQLCTSVVKENNDLSLVPELGRNKRDLLMTAFPTVKDLSEANLRQFIKGKKTVFEGIGIKTLEKFQARARLLSDPTSTPYLKEPVELPVALKEVMFDIEAEPLSNIVYLHGFIEREYGRPETEKFIDFFVEAGDETSEAECFSGAWAYLNARMADSTIYYYSSYEKTAYKALAKKYPFVCSVHDVEAMFESNELIDLYSVVRQKTEWPTNDHSIKTLAVYLGFKWRDECPSGANSIEWYSRWISTGDTSIRERIRLYNEDDCKATAVVLDGLRRMTLH